MELQVVLIGAVVFVISAVLIYLISAFTMKEKTFEEVIAEQKRQQKEELLKVKQEKKAEKDHSRKRKKTKEKAKGDQSPKVSFSDTETKEHKMVNLELEPEIIEPVEADKPLKMSKKKDKPAKPILHNKDEKTPVVSEENVEEFVHRGPTPKDDVELKMSHDKKEKAKKDKSKKQEQAPMPVVEEVMVTNVTKTQSAAPPLSFKETSSNKLITSVKTASLTDSETQSLIDILLTKQGGSAITAAADWNKKSQKGDPVALVRKQLEEKERALQEEQQMVFAANNRVKEIRQELNQEKVRSQSLEKTYKEKMDYQGREVQALQARIQHTHDQHMMETSQLRALVQKLETQGDQSRIQRMAEENNTLRESLAKAQAEFCQKAEDLQQKASIFEKELSNNTMKLNSSENTKRSLEQKVSKLEADLRKAQSNAENVVEKRLDEVSQELRKSEAKSAALSKDLQTREHAVETAQKECADLKTQLQDLERALRESDQSTRNMEEKLKMADRSRSDTEGNMKNLQNRLETIEQEKSQLVREKSELVNDIQGLKQHNNNLSTELKTTQNKLQEESVNKQPNGDMYPADKSITLEEHEKQLTVKTGEISQLTKEMEKKKSEVTGLLQQLEAQKKKNNELREKNWKAMDALEKTEKSVSEKVQSAIKEKGEEIQACQTQVESFDKSVMQRLFPDISVNKKSHKDWMTEFEREVNSYLNTMKKASADSSDNKSAMLESRVSNLESEKSDLENRLQDLQDSRDRLQSQLKESENSTAKLQTQVSQYRNVLAETENKLTQLENSVEAEEKKWQERIQAKDSQLQQVEDELSALKNESSSKSDNTEDNDIEFAYRCVEKSLTTIVDQMKERIQELETLLQTSESQCTQLQSQLKENETKIADYNEQIIVLNKSSASITEVNNELEKLRTEFTAEQKKNKELASQIVKLNGIIKTGHDALTQEQNLVKKLQEELGSGQSNSTNVPNSNNSSNEVTKLRASLAEKEKQLEKELSANKLLSQRLASSQSSLNEAGTSV